MRCIDADGNESYTEVREVDVGHILHVLFLFRGRVVVKQTTEEEMPFREPERDPAA